jgi:ParB-like nuclease domain
MSKKPRADRTRSPPETSPAIAFEPTGVQMIPIDQIWIGQRHRPLKEETVVELMESFNLSGQANPCAVAREKGRDGRPWRLVGGYHRIEAHKRRGATTIPCVVIVTGETLRLELLEIDDNLIRNNSGPAEHAKLTLRRAEIIRQLTVTQFETPSNQERRRAGEKTGPDAGSIRDQSEKTGQSTGTLQRAIKCALGLGERTLNTIGGTSLDSGVEMEALLQKTEAEREELARRAAAGEHVSARTTDGKPKPKPKRKRGRVRRPQGGNACEPALSAFRAWRATYGSLKELDAVVKQMDEIEATLSTAETANEKIAAPGDSDGASNGQEITANERLWQGTEQGPQ